MDELKSSGKPFEISKWAVWEAWEKVKENKGAAGVDGVSIEEFEKDLKNNLFKVWNRMSSGTYFPHAVRAVEIPKSHGGGTRILGVPTVADRVAQTVVAGVLEARVEPIFHPDSYGYRPKRSALDAVGACRTRCWSNNWVIDLDIRKFFDSVPWDRIVKAVEANTDLPWVVLYVKRWLVAPLQQSVDRQLPEASEGFGHRLLQAGGHLLMVAVGAADRLGDDPVDQLEPLQIEGGDAHGCGGFGGLAGISPENRGAPLR